MSTSDFDSGSSCEEDEADEEGKLYEWIYEVSNKDDKEEEVQSPSRSELKPEHTADDERSTHEAGTSSGHVSENKTTKDAAGEERLLKQGPKLHSDKKRNRSEPKITQETPARREKTEKKPWREPGADITDYFNYGFEEESWNSYRKKHTELHTANKKRNPKIKVQKGHCPHEERKPGNASSSSSYPPSTQAHRRSDGFGGPSWLHSEEELVFRETFPEEESITSYILPSPSPPDASYNPPPRVPFRQGPHRHHRRASASESSERPERPSRSPNLSSPGVTSLIPKKWAHSAGVNKSAKNWEHLMREEKCEDERGYYDRYMERCKDRERENASYACSRKKKQRHRKKTKPGQRQQTFESVSQGKEGREERRHRDKQDGWEKSSHSSRSRGEAGDDRDSQKSVRPKKKKKKKITRRRRRRSLLMKRGNYSLSDSHPSNPFNEQSCPMASD